MMSVLRRVRAYHGYFALLAVLVMVAALLLTALPRVANHMSEKDLRHDLAGLPWEARDITYLANPDSLGEPHPFPVYQAAHELDRMLATFPPVLRDAVRERWYAAQTAEAWFTPMVRQGPPPPVRFSIRAGTGLAHAVDIVEGRWPTQHATPDEPVEVVVSTAAAEALDLRVGTRWNLSFGRNEISRVIEIAGVFEAVDPDDEIWDPSPLVLEPHKPLSDDDPYLVVALADDGGVVAMSQINWPIYLSWRYRVAPERFDVGEAESALHAVRELTNNVPQGMQLLTGLDTNLRKFLDSLRSVRALLAVVVAGLLAALAGLIVLAARLAIDRRREELALLRARGGSERTILARKLAESLLVVPLGALLGWLVGVAVPGRPADTGWLVALAAVGTAFAVPTAALASRRSPVGRRDLTFRLPPVRRTAEISVLLLAALGAFLVRRRGLSTDGTVDLLLVAVPVLLAVAAALLALRAYPWPLRLIGRLAASARGAVAFFGLARAGRAGAATGPVIVLVVAIATAAFCATVATGIADGRDRAASHDLPADYLLTGEGFSQESAAELAAVPGVRAVAPIAVEPVARIYPDMRLEVNQLRAVVVVVDGPALARVAAESGAQVDLPAELTAVVGGTGPIPALVSPEVAVDLSETAVIDVGRDQHEFRVAAVVSTFPTIDRDTTRFVVLPRQALPTATTKSLDPNGFLIAGDGIDESALRSIGDRSQREWLAARPVPREPEGDTVLTSRVERRADLEQGSHNALLSFAFATGAGGGALLGLLAVAFAVFAGAHARGQVLSRLRTMGLSRRQWRGLLTFELIPMVGVATLTGTVVGGLLPLLLTPVLRLSDFTDGMPVPARIDLTVGSAAVVLTALAVGVAVAVETLINRRLRLGEVLRLGEES